MIILCKHCYDILGYDNDPSVNRVINKNCPNCVKGLRTDDIIEVDDLMVHIIRILHTKFNIRSYYSCEGHLVGKVVTESYLVIDDVAGFNTIFKIINHGEIMTSRKDGKNKRRLTFLVDQSPNIYKYSIAKIKFYVNLYKRLESM